MNVSSGPLKNQPAERKWDGSWELRLCNNPSGSHPRAAGAAALAQSGPWARTRHLCSPACVLFRKGKIMVPESAKDPLLPQPPPLQGLWGLRATSRVG